MSDETRDDDGVRRCAWCGDPIEESGRGRGRAREYCRQSHRQRAYEERQIQQRIAVATQAARAITRDEMRADAAAAPVASKSSRDDDQPGVKSSRDDEAAARSSSRDDEGAGVPEPRPAPAAPRARPRRMWDVPPSQADQMPLFGRSRPQQSGETK